jgi:hypothetical protein
MAILVRAVDLNSDIDNRIDKYLNLLETLNSNSQLFSSTHRRVLGVEKN